MSTQRRAPQHRRTGGAWKIGAEVAAAAAVLAGAFVAVQLSRSMPAARASVVAFHDRRLPGAAAAPAVPAGMAVDVEIGGIGDVWSVHAGRVYPLASVTKLVTALVVLRHHPLATGASGPTITVGRAVASAYPAEVKADESLVKVRAGEHLDELQALEALLVPSADNMATVLASWVAGSVPAFVSDMNAEAAALGLRHTHFADPAGLDAASAGTATDMAHLAATVMAQPVLRRVVAMPQVTLPVAGTVYNYDTVLGHDGIIGIKTGSTLQAGGDFVFAAHRRVDDRSFSEVGAVLHAGGDQPLAAALSEAERLSRETLERLRPFTVLPRGTPVVAVRSPWGSAVTGTTASAVRTVGLPGERVHLAVEPAAAIRGPVGRIVAGQRLASVVLGGSAPARVPALASGPLARPSVLYRLGRF